MKNSKWKWHQRFGSAAVGGADVGWTASATPKKGGT
jgi:hypothetical protein